MTDEESRDERMIRAIESVHESQKAIADGFKDYSKSVAAETVALVTQKDRRFRRFVAASIVLMLAMLAVGTWWIRTIYDNSQTNKSIISSTQEATNTIRDCTDPNGGCYAATDERLLALVSGLLYGVDANNKAGRITTLQRTECVVNGGSALDCIQRFPDLPPAVGPESTTTTTIG